MSCGQVLPNKPVLLTGPARPQQTGKALGGLEALGGAGERLLAGRVLPDRRGAHAQPAASLLDEPALDL